MVTSSHLQKRVSGNPSKSFERCAEILTRWFAKWITVFPNHPVSKVQTAVYLESLSDLSPEQLEAACKEATKTAEQFPKPGHIRGAVRAHLDRNVEFLGLPMLRYPEISQEEREAAIKEMREGFGTAWLDQLEHLTAGRPSYKERKKFLDEQKQILKERGFLK